MDSQNINKQLLNIRFYILCLDLIFFEMKWADDLKIQRTNTSLFNDVWNKYKCARFNANVLFFFLMSFQKNERRMINVSLEMRWESGSHDTLQWHLWNWTRDLYNLNTEVLQYKIDERYRIIFFFFIHYKL